MMCCPFRFTRGLKTLSEQLRQARAGRPVAEEEIPPAVATAAGKAEGPAASSSQDVPASGAAQPEPQGNHQHDVYGD